MTKGGKTGGGDGEGEGDGGPAGRRMQPGQRSLHRRRPDAEAVEAVRGVAPTP